VFKVLLNPTKTKQTKANINLKNSENEIVFDRLGSSFSILLLAAKGAKLIDPHGGLQVGK